MRMRSWLVGLATAALLAAALPSMALAAESPEGHWQFCETAVGGTTPVCSELITFSATKTFEFYPKTEFHGTYTAPSSTELVFTEDFAGCHWKGTRTATTKTYKGEGECTEQGFHFTFTLKPLKLPKYTASASIHSETGNLACGEVGSTPIIGSASFSRVGNAVTVKVKMTKGTPRRYYLVYLQAPFCANGRQLTSFTTNGKGEGKATGTLIVNSSENEFFLQFYEYTSPGGTKEETYKSTQQVSLP